MNQLLYLYFDHPDLWYWPKSESSKLQIYLMLLPSLSFERMNLALSL